MVSFKSYSVSWTTTITTAALSLSRSTTRIAGRSIVRTLVLAQVQAQVQSRAMPALHWGQATVWSSSLASSRHSCFRPLHHHPRMRVRPTQSLWRSRRLPRGLHRQGPLPGSVLGQTLSRHHPLRDSVTGLVIDPARGTETSLVTSPEVAPARGLARSPSPASPAGQASPASPARSAPGARRVTHRLVLVLVLTPTSHARPEAGRNEFSVPWFLSHLFPYQRIKNFPF